MSRRVEAPTSRRGGRAVRRVGLALLMLAIAIVGVGVGVGVEPWSGSDERVQGPSSFGADGSGRVGVPPDVDLRPSGPLEVTQAGAVVAGLDVAGTIQVRADDVTIRNTRAMSINTGGNDGSGMEFRGTVIEDVTVDGRGVSAMGIDGLNFTARRVEVLNTKNGFRLFTDSTVEDSLVHHLFADQGDHTSGIGSNGGSDLIIRRNRVDCGRVPQCSGALVLYPQPTQTRVVVEDNHLDGGGYCLYAPDHSAQDVHIVDNRFGRRAYPHCGAFGPIGSGLGQGAGNIWRGNTWLDTGEPLPR